MRNKFSPPLDNRTRTRYTSRMILALQILGLIAIVVIILAVLDSLS